MIERKNWTQDEDNILKSIVTEKKIRKWSRISKIMEQQYRIQGRSGKQCRQRWHNCLDPFINIQQWSSEEQELLYQYHNLYGNKWAKISLYLPGRSDNSIKNHFYSTLRKAFRGINRYITQTKKRTQMKPFKNIVMGKIIALAQQGLEKKKLISPQNNGIDIYSGSIQLKNHLIKYAGKLEKQEQNHEQTQRLMKQILAITKIYKCKKIKRKRKYESGNLVQNHPKSFNKIQKLLIQSNKSDDDKITSQDQIIQIDQIKQNQIKTQQQELLQQHQPIQIQNLLTSNCYQNLEKVPDQYYYIPSNGNNTINNNQFIYYIESTPLYQINPYFHHYLNTNNIYENYGYVISPHYQVSKQI